MSSWVRTMIRDSVVLSRRNSRPVCWAGMACLRNLVLRRTGAFRTVACLPRSPRSGALEAALSEPFDNGKGGTRRYRFPRQKARYLAGCLRALRDVDPPASDLALRDFLVALPGIGPKTASWIVRNHRGSDAVAIIDVHILRAGCHVGLFPVSWQPQQHYVQLECAFLEFAAALRVRASVLDALIWDYMRRLPPPSASHHPVGAPVAA